MLQKEFSFSTHSTYTARAIAFWEKPIIYHDGVPNIIEKIGTNRSLYRFEPATGTLGVATYSNRLKKVFVASFFRPGINVKQEDPSIRNPNFLHDALEYFYGL